MRSGDLICRCGEKQLACRKCCSKKGAAPVAGLATSSDEQRPAWDVWFSVSLALKLPNLRLTLLSLPGLYSRVQIVGRKENRSFVVCIWLLMMRSALWIKKLLKNHYASESSNMDIRTADLSYTAYRFLVQRHSQGLATRRV
jgi:hypothetical protein